MHPIIADTNILSDVLVGKSFARIVLTRIISDCFYIITTVITTSELFFGARRRNCQEARILIKKSFRIKKLLIVISDFILYWGVGIYEK